MSGAANLAMWLSAKNPNAPPNFGKTLPEVDRTRTSYVVLNASELPFRKLKLNEDFNQKRQQQRNEVEPSSVKSNIVKSRSSTSMCRAASEHESSDTSSLYHYAPSKKERKECSRSIAPSIHCASTSEDFDPQLSNILKDTSDTRSIKTFVTTCTVLGAPHRMQWRSPSSRKTSSDFNNEDKLPCKSDSDFVEEHEDGRIASKVTKPSANPSYQYLEVSKIEATSFSADLLDRFNWNSDLEDLDKPKKPILKHLIRPSALETAREGWVFLQSQLEGTWEKVFAIATYQLNNGAAVIHCYETQEELHPYLALDLSQLKSVASNGNVNHVLASTVVPIRLYLFSLTMGSTHTNIAAPSESERNGWIHALRLMVKKDLQKIPYAPPEYDSTQGSVIPNADATAITNSVEPLQKQLDQAQDRIQHLETLLKQHEQGQLNQEKSAKTDATVVTDLISPDFVSVLEAKTALVLEAIWASNNTANRTAETVSHDKDSAQHQESVTLNEIDVAIHDLTESMEMRTSRIGKMVHELLKVKEDIIVIKNRIAQENNAGADSTAVAIANSDTAKLLHEIVARQNSLTSDIGSLLTIAADTSMSQRQAWKDLSDADTERQSELLEQIATVPDSVLKKLDSHDSERKSQLKELLEDVIKNAANLDVRGRQNSSSSLSQADSTAMEELLHSKLDNIAEVIDFVNKSQCRLVNLVSEKLKSSPSTSPKRHTQDTPTDAPKLTAIIQEAMKTVLSERNTLTPGNVTHSSSCIDNADNEMNRSEVSTRALNTLVMESLANLESQLARTARDHASRQELVEVWMERNHECLRMIQKGVSEVEKMERSASPVRGIEGGVSSVGAGGCVSEEKRIDFETKVDLFSGKLQQKAELLVENLVTDLKEILAGRQTRLTAEIESLCEEKCGLVRDVCSLREEKDKLERETEKLIQAKKDLESVGQLNDAVSDLENQLTDRVSGLLEEIERLKKERDSLQ